VPRTRRVENLRHGARTTTAGTREGSTITVTASPHPVFASLDRKVDIPISVNPNRETVLSYV